MPIDMKAMPIIFIERTALSIGVASAVLNFNDGQ